jgi:hypothetical protein
VMRPDAGSQAVVSDCRPRPRRSPSAIGDTDCRLPLSPATARCHRRRRVARPLGEAQRVQSRGHAAMCRIEGI